jgi:DNA-binding transcriptional MocR family regulator
MRSARHDRTFRDIRRTPGLRAQSGTSGSRMPSRRLLAERMRCSVDSVDRAMRDLETTGLVRVEHCRRGRENLTNRYYVRTTNPTEKGTPGCS